MSSSKIEPILCDTLSQRDQRAVVLNLLYAMESLGYDVSLESIVKNIEHGYSCKIEKNKKIFSVAKAVLENRDEMDREIEPLLSNWKFERIGVITRLILRYAIWELKYTDTVPNIIINEAVELAKYFAETDAYKFVNGVLDEWRKQHERN